MTSRMSHALGSRSSSLFEALEPRWLLAFQPELVADLNTFALSSNPSNYVTSGQLTYFFADDAVHGRELWRSDGTSQGTAFVKDLTPGAAGTDVIDQFDVDGKLLILAGPEDRPRKLWVSDGTGAGTIEIATALGIRWGKTYAAVLQGTLYFTIASLYGFDLWRTDGTSAGTSMVYELRGAGRLDRPVQHVELTAIGNRLYFFANDGAHGFELWTSDGTAAGTHIAKDIQIGPSSGVSLGYVSEDGQPLIANENGKAVFLTDHPTQGLQLWRSDGSEAGTVAVKTFGLDPGAAMPYLVQEINGQLFFSATGVVGLWKSNSGGYERVSDLAPRHMAAVGDHLYFAAWSNATGVELWKSNANGANAVLVADIEEGSWDSSPKDFFSSGPWLYFRTERNSLWRTDGTAGGTTRLMNTVAEVRLGTVRCSTGAATLSRDGTSFTLFTGQSSSGGCELWLAPSGATEPPRLVRDVKPSTEGSNAHAWTDVNGTLFFVADDDNLDQDLWTVTGGGGVSRLRDTRPGNVEYYSPFVGKYEFEPLNGKLVFSARTMVYGDELWSSDGTAGGTHLIKDLLPGPGGSSPEILARVGNVLYFRTYFPEANYNYLWKTDGTAAGTVLVTDRWPGNIQIPYPGHGPTGFMAFDDQLYFIGWDAEHGSELWRSDGTDAGTIRVTDVSPGPTNSLAYPSFVSPVAVGDRLYFFAEDANGVSSLWQTLGSSATTSLVALNVTPSRYYPQPTMLAARDKLFFRGNSDEYGTELWVSDATGTRVARDIKPGTQTSDIRFLTDASGTLFFVADDGVHGRELWASDGTAAGTRLVSDISQASAEPRDLYSVNGILFFTADDGVHGRELWRSDGTIEGTWMVSDLNRGQQASNPSGFAFSGNSLYFNADNGATGVELWRLTRLPGDIDFNDHVDLDDLNIVRDWFGAEGVEVAGDVDRDGYVDLADLNIVRDWFGASIPSVARHMAAAPTTDIAPNAVRSAFHERDLATDALFSLPAEQFTLAANSSWNKRIPRGTRV